MVDYPSRWDYFDSETQVPHQMIERLAEYRPDFHNKRMNHARAHGLAPRWTIIIPETWPYADRMNGGTFLGYEVRTGKVDGVMVAEELKPYIEPKSSLVLDY